MYNCLIYTTASHTPEAPRARALIELNRGISPEEGEQLGQAAQMQILGSAVLWQESFSLSKQLVDNSVLTLQNIDQIWGRTPLTADWVLPWANELLVSESRGHASVLNELPTVSRALGHSLK